jgi:hypothetical protein
MKLSPEMVAWIKFKATEYDSEEEYLENLRRQNEQRPQPPDIKYTDGKIYDLTFEGGVVYRGSTTRSLSQRLSGHRTSSQHGHLSAFIKKVGAENINIRLVENYPCRGKTELLARERILVRKESSTNKNLLNRHYVYYETQSFLDILESAKLV